MVSDPEADMAGRFHTIVQKKTDMYAWVAALYAVAAHRKRVGGLADTARALNAPDA